MYYILRSQVHVLYTQVHVLYTQVHVLYTQVHVLYTQVQGIIYSGTGYYIYYIQVQGNKESHTNIAAYCEVLAKLLPDTIRLPRFDYRSVGILGFYQKNLEDMVQFPDLRTVVFQAFREVGNAVLLILHLEHALVSIGYSHSVVVVIATVSYSSSNSHSVVTVIVTVIHSL